MPNKFNVKVPRPKIICAPLSQ